MSTQDEQPSHPWALLALAAAEANPSYSTNVQVMQNSLRYVGPPPDRAAEQARIDEACRKYRGLGTVTLPPDTPAI